MHISPSVEQFVSHGMRITFKVLSGLLTVHFALLISRLFKISERMAPAFQPIGSRSQSVQNSPRSPSLPRLQNLNHTVASNTEKGATANLLKDVSGYLQPSEMTALVRLSYRPNWHLSLALVH